MRSARISRWRTSFRSQTLPTCEATESWAGPGNGLWPCVPVFSHYASPDLCENMTDDVMHSSMLKTFIWLVYQARPSLTLFFWRVWDGQAGETIRLVHQTLSIWVIALSIVTQQLPFFDHLCVPPNSGGALCTQSIIRMPASATIKKKNFFKWFSYKNKLIFPFTM